VSPVHVPLYTWPLGQRCSPWSFWSSHLRHTHTSWCGTAKCCCFPRVSNKKALSTRTGEEARGHGQGGSQRHTLSPGAESEGQHTAHAPFAFVDASVGVYLFAFAVAPAFREFPCASSSSSPSQSNARDEAVVVREMTHADTACERVSERGTTVSASYRCTRHARAG